jgi:hypothetical protein
MEPLTNEEAAYVAGFFDGEGSIGVYRESRSLASGERTQRHEFYLQFGNNNLGVIQWIHGLFGVGRVRLLTKTRCNLLEIRKTEHIELVLRALLPHLRVKRPQALLALDAIAASKERDWDAVVDLAARLKALKRPTSP